MLTTSNLLIRPVVSIIIFLFISISISKGDSTKIIYSFASQSDIISLLALCFIYFIINKDVRPSKTTCVFVFIIVSIILIGRSFYNFNSSDGIIGTIKDFGIFSIQVALLTYIFSKFSQIATDKIKTIPNVKNKNSLFLFHFSIILCLWMPFLIVLFPGTPTFDGMAMLNWGYGIWPPNDHHPFIQSLFYAKIISLKDYFGETFAFGLLFGILSLFQLINYSLSSYILSKQKLGDIFPWYFYPLFFGIIPLFPLYSQAIMKDGSYASCFVLFCVSLLSLLNDHNINSKFKIWFIFFYSAIFLCLIRHNGIYVVVFSLISILIFMGRKNIDCAKRIFVILITIISMMFCLKKIIYPLWDVYPATARETYGIFGQMIGRVVADNFNQLSNDDKKEIAKSIPKFQTIPKVYNPEIFNPVKNLIEFKVSRTEIISLTAQICKKFPKSCLKGLVNYTYLYFYPFGRNHFRPVFPYGITTDFVNTGYFDYKYYFSQKLRKKIIYYSNFWVNTFPLSLFCNPALSSFLLITVFCIVLLKKKIKLVIVTSPIFLSLIMNLMSPVNGDVRYALPIISSLPLLLVIAMSLIREDQF